MATRVSPPFFWEIFGWGHGYAALDSPKVMDGETIIGEAIGRISATRVRNTWHLQDAENLVASDLPCTEPEPPYFFLPANPLSEQHKEIFPSHAEK